jgi:hypothetical protein
VERSAVSFSNSHTHSSCLHLILANNGLIYYPKA